MVEEQNERRQAALLIGRGSRVTPLISQAASGQLSADIVAVVTHKRLEEDSAGKFSVDVPGIAIAKEHQIPTIYRDWTLRRQLALTERGLIREEFRPEYFEDIAEFILANSRDATAVFMLGWDVIVPPSFLKRFTGPRDGVFNVFNMHPALLPNNPQDDFYILQEVAKGTRVPVIKGEHDEVLAKAFAQKLPALGSTIHYAVENFDEGPVILRTEVPILPTDTIETYDGKLKVAEEQLAIDAFEKWAKGELD
jgi:folate-dependent phosphoribosylglycinamide formyltransferase PurN